MRSVASQTACGENANVSEIDCPVEMRPRAPAATLLRSKSVTILLVVLLGLLAGVMVGLLGIGGGIVMVPAMVHLLHMDQHLAQGTSLFILLFPIGLGALRQYWKSGNVDLRAGILCAVGMILGALIGGKIAVPMPTQLLKGLFGAFLMFSAVLLWFKAKPAQSAATPLKEGQA
jgi:uncharacterized membrane protein YfcA